ncbi:Zn(II)2Cys6 transcription factor [Aspergillus undulatus]|uniref:Zn(II)2Cys6 transcription factor n=1 Tax=Aspergillus undulatus TaxID=1810928 RepID=UPI003CCCD12F
MEGHTTNNRSTRKRTSLACDTCRRQKEKCEGGPPCWRCQRLGRQCTVRGFTHPLQSSRRSPPQEQEQEWCRARGYCQESVARVEGLERIVRHFLGDVSLDEESVKRIADRLAEGARFGGLGGNAEGYGLEQRQRQRQRQAQGANVDESFDVQFVSKDIAHYSGEFSHWNFSQKLRRRVSQIDRFGVKEYWRPTQLQSSLHLVSQTLPHLPPRQITDFLITMFFKYATGNLFYVEESWIQERVERAYNPSMCAYALGDIPWVCSLFAVLAVGTQVAHMEGYSTSTSSPGVQGAAQGINIDIDLDPCSEDSVGLSLYHIACRLVPDVLLVASHESVQAFLLLALYALPVSTGGLSYSYLGIAVKMAIQNGMHRKFGGEGCDTRIVEIRNRVFWTAFTLDKRISIFHGRPASIAKSDISTDLPRDTLSFPTPKYANMMAFIRLSEWLGDVAETLNLLKSSPKKFVLDNMNRLVQLGSHIARWWSSLPSTIECRDTTPDSPLMRQNTHLTLAYLLIHIYMGRPFMFASDRCFPSNADEESISSSSSSNDNDPRITLVNGCIQAAISTLHTLHTLSIKAGHCRASYTEFSSCRAALLVILADRLISRDLDRFRAELEQGMGMIRRMSGGSSNESEISYLVSLDKAIQAALLSGDENGSGEGVGQRFGEDGQGPGQSAYARFKQWTSAVKGAVGFSSSASFTPGLELALFSPLSFMNSDFLSGSAETGVSGLVDPWPSCGTELHPDAFTSLPPG